MQALVADPAAPPAVRMSTVPRPVAMPGQVLVDVHHVSLNRGDVNDARSGRVLLNGVLGSDAAGVVVASVTGGPAVGARVVALTEGACAQRIAVDVGALAELPASVGLAEAAGGRLRVASPPCVQHRRRPASSTTSATSPPSSTARSSRMRR